MTTKLLTCFSAGILLATAVSAQTLFTYGNKTVSQQEFLRAFEKNPDSGNRQTAMKEYLPLYINYKLKVQDALDKKMDTLPNQKEEFESYRNQLAETFISDKSNTGLLVQEAFERSQRDIKLGHLFVGFDPKDSASVRKASENAAKAYAMLNHYDLADAVKQFSTDEKNKAAGGVAGWITVFSIPYQYESVVYHLPPGAHSEVIKSAVGFHIFKRLADRPAQGRVKVAQIMLVNTDKTNPANEERNKKLADSLYLVLKNGGSFDSLAEKFSNDRTSYSQGGVLPEFGVGQFNGEFEDQAFGLRTRGDISKPFTTEYGWHILKLLEKFPVATTLEQADLNGRIQQQVTASGRTKAARAFYINSQMPKLGYKASPVSLPLLWQYTDSSMQGGNTKGLQIKETTPVFSFGKQNVTTAEWVQYVKTIRMSPGSIATKPYPELMKDFTQESAEAYLVKNLEKTDPVFARQLKEFKEANLLFEAMDKNVWTKAAADSAGLAKYYQQHKDKYHWGASASALLITSTDSTITGDVLQFVKSNLNDWRQLAEKYPVNLVADSGRYEISQIPVGGAVDFKKGMVTVPVKNEMDGSQTFAGIFDLLPPDGQRSYEEARGFVINDYQQVLEDKWLAALKKKYPVKVNEPAWQKLQAKK